MATILIAAAPENVQMMEVMLNGHDTVCAGTMAEAARFIAAQRFDLILIDVYFDDSRMFDLLKQLRHSEANKNAPAICFRSVADQSGIIDATLDGIRTSAKLLGACEFLEYDHRDGHCSFDSSQARSQIENELDRDRRHRRAEPDRRNAAP